MFPDEKLPLWGVSINQKHLSAQLIQGFFFHRILAPPKDIWTFCQSQSPAIVFQISWSKSLSDVYNESLKLIETGQAPSLAGETYTINTNQKSDTKALILAVNDNAPNDFIEVVMQKTSQDTTRLAVKYGKQGNSLKSATFISLIQEK